MSFATMKWKVTSAWIRFKAKREARAYWKRRMFEEARLRAMANPKCSKCYGRGYLGMNVQTNHFEFCRCTRHKEGVKGNGTRS